MLDFSDLGVDALCDLLGGDGDDAGLHVADAHLVRGRHKLDNQDGGHDQDDDDGRHREDELPVAIVVVFEKVCEVPDRVRW